MVRVAIVDDEAASRAMLTGIVERMGHVAVPFPDAESISATLLRDVFDLVILDWVLPDRDGLSVLRWMRQTLAEPVRVIMLTNRTAKRDIVEALQSGADDYISKPEDADVIAARIAAVLRRDIQRNDSARTASYGSYTFDRIQQRVSFAGGDVALTAKEFELAELLFDNCDRTLSRAYIMELIWRTNAALTTRTLDMHLSRVRNKLQLSPANGYRVQTVFGYGYRLEKVDQPA